MTGASRDPTESGAPAPPGPADEPAPDPATTEALRRIWAEVLAAPRVGDHDEFLALGGTSLHAMRIVLRIMDDFAVELPLSSLLRVGTLAEMARDLEDALWARRALRGGAEDALPGEELP